MNSSADDDAKSASIERVIRIIWQTAEARLFWGILTLINSFLSFYMAFQLHIEACSSIS